MPAVAPLFVHVAMLGLSALRASAGTFQLASTTTAFQAGMEVPEGVPPVASLPDLFGGSRFWAFYWAKRRTRELCVAACRMMDAVVAVPPASGVASFPLPFVLVPGVSWSDQERFSPCGAVARPLCRLRRRVTPRWPPSL